jgi:PAS domain S-box-containing protein
VFGYPRERIRGATAWFEERVHPEDRGRVLAGLEAVLGRDRAEVWEDEYRFLRADGSYACVADRGYVVRDGATGEAMRMVGSMRDVTQARRHAEQLRESEERYRTTFERAPIGLARVSPNGRWLLINEKLCELSGYRREELLRTSFLELTPREDREASLERVRLLLAGEIAPYTIERRYLRKDGSYIWASLSVSLVRDPSTGEPSYFSCTVEDITKRKLVELSPEQHLTPREQEVLECVLRGDSNARIAREFHLSLPTVKTHVRNILRKRGAKKRWELFLR